MADPREKEFQNDVLESLTDNGWLKGESKSYNRALGLYSEDVVAFYREAFPDEWAAYGARYPVNTEGALLKSVARGLDKDGALSVLRHGFKDRGARVRLAQFRPDHGLNPDILARYELNRLRVVPELVYSPHGYDGRLDLVLFVNGIPTATLELKSEFTQAVELAKRQYKRDRPPIDPVTRKPEPLLTFKRGALVHFAVSQTEVYMSTKLAGDDTFFLPFNVGTPGGGAGNPTIPGKYDTHYLWEEVFAPENWLRLLGRFVHLESKDVEDPLGRKSRRETMIFPRYHQWDVVNKLVKAAATEGPGGRYLVQHSAGSGKSNSIAWTAHQLASLYDGAGEKLFQSVIVVTDRTVLDSQLQETIYQFDHKEGVVARISREEGEGSKSAQLTDALEDGTPIIIVTLQAFPFVLEAVQERTTLKGKSFAVIADEAHSSQSGRTAVKLRQVLLAEADEDLSGEDLLNRLLEARKQAGTLSYFAFTATPKSKTLELFGRRPDPAAPPSAENKPVVFHDYTMRQAIEEGFILDVLKNYTTYELAYQLGQKDSLKDSEVPGRKASKELAKWLRIHPYNISQKVAVIVEHFRATVTPLLSGQAKAMVVTGGRKDAVRYKLAIDAYVRDNAYDDVRALVAFSGDVTDAAGELGGLDLSLARGLGKEAATDAGLTFTFSERTMNPAARGDLRSVFDGDAYNVMIAANKFQTGFDQPKLVAMYVDKKLAGVDAVQALSRLNRTYPGKEKTFVLDFVNDPETIQEAFQPYYQTTVLDETSEPNLVYDLFDALRDERIYQWDEVEAFVDVFFAPGGSQADLLTHCRPAVERYRARFREASAKAAEAQGDLKRAEAAGDVVAAVNAQREGERAQTEGDALELFKKNAGSFLRFYEFMSQIIAYDDADLEKLSVFLRHLLPLLRQAEAGEAVDLSNVQLTHYRLAKKREQDVKLKVNGAAGLVGVTQLGSGTAKDDPEERL